MKYFIAESRLLSPLPISQQEFAEKYLPMHEKHIADGIAEGIVLFAGPKVSEGGGIMVARAETREALDAFLDADPFTCFGLARFEVKEFMMKDRSDIVMGF